MDTIGLYLMATCVFSVTNAQVLTGSSAAKIELVGKTVTQSSTGHGGTPDRAIDGMTNPNYHDKSCTHTNSEQGAWWEVDIGNEVCVGRVVIYNRQDCCKERLNGAIVRVGSNENRVNEECGRVSLSENNEDNVIELICNIEGRYLSVELPGTEYLTLCEVKAFGGNCIDASCVPECVFGACSASNTCTCNEGYTGSTCDTRTVCLAGWDIGNRGGPDSAGWTMVSPSKVFTCNGSVSEWRYQAKASHPFRAVVWRQVTSTPTQFEIVGINDIPAGAIDTEVTYQVPANERIAVTDGDTIGWSFGEGVLTYNSGGGALVRWVRGHLHASLVENQIRDINGDSQNREYSIKATVAEASNDCDSNPCMNGQCEDGTNQYTCDCDAGWTGNNCDQAVTTRASVVTWVATSSALVVTESLTTTSTIEALASDSVSLANQKSSGSASTTAGASIAFVFLLSIIVCIVVLVVVKRRRRQQQQESSKSQTAVQLDGPYGDTVTNIFTSPPTKDSHIYTGAPGANGDAVATPPTEELYQDVSDKPSEVLHVIDETYQNITEDATQANQGTDGDDIYQDVQDNEYAYAHVDTERDKVPGVDGGLVEIYAKSEYGGVPRSAENGNQQEGWVDNDIYALSDEDAQLKRQLGGDNREKGWVENDIYARSNEDQLKLQGGENDKKEGWMDNSIYAATDE